MPLSPRLDVYAIALRVSNDCGSEHEAQGFWPFLRLSLDAFILFMGVAAFGERERGTASQL